MSILDDLRQQIPEFSVAHVNEFASQTNNHIGVINNCSSLSEDQKKEICEYIETLHAFFQYTSPLIETVATCRLDEVKLVRRDIFEYYQSLIRDFTTIGSIESQRVSIVYQDYAVQKGQLKQEIERLNEKLNENFQ